MVLDPAGPTTITTLIVPRLRGASGGDRAERHDERPRMSEDRRQPKRPPEGRPLGAAWCAPARNLPPLCRNTARGRGDGAWYRRRQGAQQGSGATGRPSGRAWGCVAGGTVRVSRARPSSGGGHPTNVTGFCRGGRRRSVGACLSDACQPGGLAAVCQPMPSAVEGAEHRPVPPPHGDGPRSVRSRTTNRSAGPGDRGDGGTGQAHQVGRGELQLEAAPAGADEDPSAGPSPSRRRRSAAPGAGASGLIPPTTYPVGPLGGGRIGQVRPTTADGGREALSGPARRSTGMTATTSRPSTLATSVLQTRSGATPSAAAASSP